MVKHLNDNEIIQGIVKGGRKMESALEALYLQNRKMIFSLINKNSGHDDQAKDILQEVVITFFEQVKKGKYQQTGKISTYLYSIARFMWLNKLKRAQIEKRLIEIEKVMDIAYSDLPKSIERDSELIILELFGKLDEACRKVLHLSIFEHYSADEIAELMQFKNGQIVRNKKYKCMKRLKEILAEHPRLSQRVKIELYGS
jgi:RNA polymerase sigma factor (sigma-70 family)